MPSFVRMIVGKINEGPAPIKPKKKGNKSPKAKSKKGKKKKGKKGGKSGGETTDGAQTSEGDALNASMATHNSKFPFEFIGGQCWCDQDAVLTPETVLTPGEYLCYIEIDWENHDFLDKFTFRTYSEHPTKITEVEQSLYPNFLEGALKSCASKISERSDYSEKGEPDIFRSISITDSNAEYGFLYYENNSQTSTLVECVKFNDLTNLEFLPPYGGIEVRVVVPPGKNEIVIMKRTAHSCKYNCLYYTSIQKPMD